MSQDFSRRRFLTSAAILTAASTLPSRALASRTGGDVFTNASVGAYVQGLLTREHFETLIGTLFLAFLDDDRTAYMRLRSVEELKPRQTKDAVAAFHLSFSTGGVAVEQGSYLLDHATLGRFALFLVPGVAAHGELTCGAVFASIGTR